MASVQQLEKLHQIQRLFYVEDSLESVVAGERVNLLISRTEQLIRQRAFLRDERRRVRMSSEMLEERKRSLKTMRREDWKPTGLAPSSPSSSSAKATSETVVSKHIMINIGGLMYEVPATILLREPGSLLAQLTTDPPIIFPDNGGFFYFERDWWLFRYIMNFMRDGVLPDDRNLLSQLYREASYWKLDQMQKAIEEQKLHLRSEIAADLKLSEAEKTTLAKEQTNIWWRKLPSWWRSVDEVTKKAEAATAEAKKAKEEDWWLSTTYKGKIFLPLSSLPDKVVTKAGEKDVLAVPSTVYERSPSHSVSRSYNYTDSRVATSPDFMKVWPQDHHAHPGTSD